MLEFSRTISDDDVRSGVATCNGGFVAPEDPMFKRLTRGRDELFTGLTTDLFESTARRRFEIVRSQKIEHTERHLYLLRKIPGISCA
jgi:hypothetical protein